MTDATCEEHHIALTPHIVPLGEDDEHALPEQLVCRLCFLEDGIYEQGHRLLALQADNHRLRAAIGRHRDKVVSLGQNVDRRGKPVHGGEWDRDLWAVLYDFARPEPGDQIRRYDGRTAHADWCANHRHEGKCLDVLLDKAGDDGGELRDALRQGVSDLSLAIGTLEAHWEHCCGNPDHLPPVQLRTTLDVMSKALEGTDG